MKKWYDRTEWVLEIYEETYKEIKFIGEPSFWDSQHIDTSTKDIEYCPDYPEFSTEHG